MNHALSLCQLFGSSTGPVLSITVPLSAVRDVVPQSMFKLVSEVAEVI